LNPNATISQSSIASNVFKRKKLPACHMAVRKDKIDKTGDRMRTSDLNYGADA
jgi:hypothetical protein